jgi:hypothetical protein
MTGQGADAGDAVKGGSAAVLASSLESGSLSFGHFYLGRKYRAVKSRRFFWG